MLKSFRGQLIGFVLYWEFQTQIWAPALLKGEPDLLSPKELTSKACQALQQVADAISNQQAAQWAPELCFFSYNSEPR